MEKEIKNPEEMNENKEMHAIDENDLGEVAGGSFINTIKEKWQRFRMSEQEKNEINSLLMRYDLLREQVIRRTTVMAYGGPAWFDESHRLQEELKDIENKLKAYAKKYPNVPELEPFRN